MFQQFQIGEKPEFDFKSVRGYATACEHDELIAEAWDGRDLPDATADHDSHHTRNEYHAIYKTKDGEYNIYSFMNIGYVPAIPVSAEKLERALAAEPACIHVEHCGWSDGGEPLDNAILWWKNVTSHLASRTLQKV